MKEVKVVEGDCGSVLHRVAIPNGGLTVGTLRELVEKAQKSSGICMVDGVLLPDGCKLSSTDVVRFYPDAAQPTTEFWGNSATPSSYSYPKTMAKQTSPSGPEIFNFTPSKAAPPVPLPLVHSAFGRFLDMFHGSGVEETQLSKDDTKMYNELSNACMRFYSQESHYVKAVSELWSSYTGCTFQREMATGESEKGGMTRTDSASLDSTSRVVAAFLEGERGVSGNSIEPNMQVAKNYSFFWIDSAHLRERYRETCYPAVLIEHIGPLVRASAVGTLAQVCVQPLTPFVSFLKLQGHDLVAAEEGVRFCRAVKMLLEELQAYYRDFLKEDEDDGGGEDEDDDGNGKEDEDGSHGDMVGARELYRAGVPYPLHSLIDNVEELHQQGRVFGHEDLIEKFVQREYGEAVHKAWAASGLAPELISVERLPGGWLQITMERLGSDWIRLQEHPRADEMRSKVLEALDAAHRVVVGMDERGKPTFGVHGDMRDANVMVQGDGASVKFIDFDWAKEEGKLYPPFMNHEGINWPSGVEDYKPMLQQHDKELLATPQKMQLKCNVRARARRHKERKQGKAKLKGKLKAYKKSSQQAFKLQG